MGLQGIIVQPGVSQASSKAEGTAVHTAGLANSAVEDGAPQSAGRAVDSWRSSAPAAPMSRRSMGLAPASSNGEAIGKMREEPDSERARSDADLEASVLDTLTDGVLTGLASSPCATMATALACHAPARLLCQCM